MTVSTKNFFPEKIADCCAFRKEKTSLKFGRGFMLRPGRQAFCQILLYYSQILLIFLLLLDFFWVIEYTKFKENTSCVYLIEEVYHDVSADKNN